MKITENFTRCENAYADFRGVFYFGGEFNAVIMYIMMPKLDGIEAVKRTFQKYGRDFIRQILHVRPKNGNSGLGLYMVKWIAECHGGRVSCESRIGVGSVFTFVMPMNGK